MCSILNAVYGRECDLLFWRRARQTLDHKPFDGGAFRLYHTGFRLPKRTPLAPFRISSEFAAAYRNWSWEARCSLSTLVERALQEYHHRQSQRTGRHDSEIVVPQTLHIAAQLSRRPRGRWKLHLLVEVVVASGPYKTRSTPTIPPSEGKIRSKSERSESAEVRSTAVPKPIAVRC